MSSKTATLLSIYTNSDTSLNPSKHLTPFEASKQKQAAWNTQSHTVGEMRIRSFPFPFTKPKWPLFCPASTVYPPAARPTPVSRCLQVPTSVFLVCRHKMLGGLSNRNVCSQPGG